MWDVLLLFGLIFLAGAIALATWWAEQDDDDEED